MKIVRRVEKRYRLHDGYFADLLFGRVRAPSVETIRKLAPSDRRRLAWHLPNDFGDRSAEEQSEIVDWVRENILSASTPYHRYQKAKSGDRYGLRFAGLTSRSTWEPRQSSVQHSKCQIAPPTLQTEMESLIRFKNAELCPAGMSRTGTWNEATVAQRTEHLGLMLGAMSAKKASRYAGLGVDRRHLSFGFLALAEVWDWYLDWRRTRRGFFTSWEADMLSLGAALNRPKTGWLWQSPALATRLSNLEGLGV